jgi:hypothetical protein
MKLLSNHMYLLDDGDRIVRVIMNNAEDNGRVGARVFRRLQKGDASPINNGDQAGLERITSRTGLSSRSPR